jgi:hypothetical protein
MVNFNFIDHLEKTEILNFYPQFVIEDEGTFTMNITLDHEAVLNSGKFYIGIASNTEKDQRYETVLSNRTNIQTKMNSISYGKYPIQIYYFNDLSFEFRSMFTISKQVNVTFLRKSTISLISPTNLMLVNSTQNITVKLSNEILLVSLNSVKCKLDGVYVATFAVSADTFICSLYSSVEKVSNINLFFKDQNALNSEILLTNNLPFVFYSKFLIIDNIRNFGFYFGFIFNPRTIKIESHVDIQSNQFI